MREIPFSPPDITEAEIQEVAEALRSGWITTGKRTKAFEARIAERLGTPKAVCLNSATAALEMTLRILGVGPGDEVITSAYTYTASAAVAVHCGATLVLADTAPGSFEMDYDRLESLITPRTKAIIPVDLGGRMCEYEKIFAAVEGKKALFQPANPLQKLFGRVIVVADAAHAFGAVRKGVPAGQAADFTCFSFHAVKNLTTGEGGAVTWNPRDGLDDEWLYHEYMLMSLHGQSKDAFSKNQLGAWEYDIVYPAYKCNMPDTLAAIGLRQLDRYDGMLTRRREIIKRYDAAAAAAGGTHLVHFDGENQSSGHLYLLRITGFTETQRNALITEMAKNGVATNVHYKPLPMMTAYRKLGFDIADFPNAYEQYANEITLPLNTRLTDEDVDTVCQQLLAAVEKVRCTCC